MLSKLLKFLPKLRSGALATRLFINKKCVVQIIRSKKIVGVALMDLSNVFDSIPHDLLIAKMYAYGFSIDVLHS